MQSTKLPEQADRRGFLKKSLTVVAGAVAVVVPVGAGLKVALDPLRGKSAGERVIKVTTLDNLPADGVPRRFPVIASKTDAWNTYEAAPIGAVYLRRVNEDKVEALNVVCPHAGCFVDFKRDQGKFLCPCHRSSFEVDGKIADGRSPSPRGLDSLTVTVDKEGAVWVAFQNFIAGRASKVPVA